MKTSVARGRSRQTRLPLRVLNALRARASRAPVAQQVRYLAGAGDEQLAVFRDPPGVEPRAWPEYRQRPRDLPGGAEEWRGDGGRALQ